MMSNEEHGTRGEQSGITSQPPTIAADVAVRCLKVAQPAFIPSVSRQTNAGALLSGDNAKRSDFTSGFADTSAPTAARHSRDSPTPVRDAP